MSKLNPGSTAINEGANLLLQLLQNIPGWEGPSKTEFDMRLRDLIQKLESTQSAIEAIFLAEVVVETVAEAALL